MRPLNTGWRIFCDDLPARLLEGETDTTFHLPGADTLADFGDLLGKDASFDVPEPPPTGAPFPLPAMIPEDVRGAAELRLELDFGRLNAQDAELTFELIRGRGRVFIDDTPTAAFQNPKDGMLRVPLFRALHLGRKQTIRLCFDASRPAGVLGGVCLHAVSHARLRDTLLIPDGQTQTIRLHTTVCAMDAGDYLLRVLTACDKDTQPIHDYSLSLPAGKQQSVEMAFPFPSPRFQPGVPYAGCAIRLTLFKRAAHRGAFIPGSLCDEQTLSCGYSGRAADYDLPLLPGECADPDVPMWVSAGRARIRFFLSENDARRHRHLSSRRHGRHARAAFPSRMRILRACAASTHVQSAHSGRVAALRADSLPENAAHGCFPIRIAFGCRRQSARPAKSGYRRRFAVASRRPRSAQRGSRAAGAFFGFALCARRLAG